MCSISHEIGYTTYNVQSRRNYYVVKVTRAHAYQKPDYENKVNDDYVGEELPNANSRHLRYN